ncbi:MAG: 50S ribosomal protein L28 [Candidatus Blackburnbacteria bacterium]|nr:50S ribosomal protein L28 [Candidatus Blackburnbacteria bacterium]
MSMICDKCGKGKQRGHRVSHSGIRTKRVFLPNLHTHWVLEDKRYIKRKFCTKCLRQVKNVTRAVKIGGRRVSAVQTGQS